MKPRELVEKWVEAFNRADAEALSAFYSEDATNHQVAEEPVVFLRLQGLPLPGNEEGDQP